MLFIILQINTCVNIFMEWKFNTFNYEKHEVWINSSIRAPVVKWDINGLSARYNVCKTFYCRSVNKYTLYKKYRWNTRN